MRIEGNILYLNKRTYNLDNMPEKTKIELGVIKKKADKPKEGSGKVEKKKKEVKEGD